jgi:hypothetical protein
MHPIFLSTWMELGWRLTNQKQELPVAAMFVNGSGRSEQTL